MFIHLSLTQINQNSTVYKDPPPPSPKEHVRISTISVYVLHNSIPCHLLVKLLGTLAFL